MRLDGVNGCLAQSHRARTVTSGAYRFFPFESGAGHRTWFLSPHPFPGLQSGATVVVVVDTGDIVVVVEVLAVVVGEPFGVNAVSSKDAATAVVYWNDALTATSVASSTHADATVTL